jgi:hypothetical protein
MILYESYPIRSHVSVLEAHRNFEPALLLSIFLRSAVCVPNTG